MKSSRCSRSGPRSQPRNPSSTLQARFAIRCGGRAQSRVRAHQGPATPLRATRRTSRSSAAVQCRPPDAPAGRRARSANPAAAARTELPPACRAACQESPTRSTARCSRRRNAGGNPQPECPREAEHCPSGPRAGAEGRLYRRAGISPRSRDRYRSLARRSGVPAERRTASRERERLRSRERASERDPDRAQDRP